MGSPSSMTSVTVNCSENQNLCSSNAIKPPIWNVDPIAQASAAENPGQIGFGYMERSGHRCMIQVRKSWRHRTLALLKVLLLELGFRIRSQSRRSESLIFAKSVFVETGWCRTETKRPPLGIPVLEGTEMNWRLSFRCCQRSGHMPGSMLYREAGDENKSA